MGLSLKDDETERRVRRLAERRGIGLTAAIRLAVDNELAKDEWPDSDEKARRLRVIREVQERVAKLPILMSDEEVDRWMYDENGLPH